MTDAVDATAQTPKLPPLDIRPFQPQDYNEILQLIADNTLQLARLSNVRIYLHPATLSAWVLCLAIIVQWSGTWQSGDYGRLILLITSTASAVLISGEWFTRNKFEAKATEIVKSDASLQDIPKIFGKDKFLVAILGNELIGLVGLQVEGRVGTVKYWHVKARYRNRGLGWDLLERVIELNKGSKKHSLQRVQCDTYNLQKRAEKTLKDHGFERMGNDVPEPGLLGWFGIRTRTWVKKL